MRRSLTQLTSILRGEHLALLALAQGQPLAHRALAQVQPLALANRALALANIAVLRARSSGTTL